MGRETYAGNVAFEVRGHLGLITLNRPKALNSLTQLMCESIIVQLADWAEDDAVTQVLVRGAGDRGLCAGGDIVALYQDMVSQQPQDGGPLLPEGTPAYQAHFGGEDFLTAEYVMNLATARFPKPYIALMDGVVLGGGIGVSAHGSHRIVTERTRAGMPETMIGFSPDAGGSYLYGRAPGRLGLHAGMTSLHVGAADALHMGLADVQIDSSSIDELTQALTEEHVDQVLPRFSVSPEPAPLAEAAVWIEDAYSAETVEEIMERLLELSEEHPGAGQALDVLRAASPTMVKVAHRAISLAAELSLEAALSQEFTIAVHALRSHDFREGIRAQVVDKDKSPRWRPAAVTEVDEDLLAHYFTPVPGKLLTLL
ncbi:enoyl-CoA hydratase/isomerase family protein [Nesterenkonia flava]|uniref:3-hydroxyisobutyryl-CoA hydrolase n=1 Tax=Nesterenkonia flava TaxID=469799 RepID=A0ABU1FUP2_9MICC|nr:enoyl-CoA hydratase/isomerase family protein [Nesterenkonia flava]MDR5712366.1 enoyl-CoA hydratase/isomerase family protein [Nesterenkonia flava]